MPASDGRHKTPRDIVPGFAALVKAKREEKELSLHDLAKISGLGATSICCIEKEYRAPSLRLAMVLAQALGINTSLRNPAGAPTQPAKKKKKKKAAPNPA